MPKTVLNPSVRAVVFDAVGTLIFPNPTAPIVYAGCARRRGFDCHTPTVRARMIAAYDAEEAIDRAAGWVTSEGREVERWRRIVSAALADLPDPGACFSELYEHFARAGSWAVNPDAANVLHELAARGVVFGLASNYDSRLFRVLDGLPELRPVRERVVVSSAVGHRKPAAQFFQAVADLMTCDPGQIAFVGDDYANDYLGAREFGFPAVLLDERDRFPRAVRIRRLRELLG
jgi:putative hydrolase of the HAD superfamily